MLFPKALYRAQASSDPLLKLTQMVRQRQGVYAIPSVSADLPTITVGSGYAAPAFSNAQFSDLLAGNGATHSLADTWTQTYSPGGNNFYVPNGSHRLISTDLEGTSLALKMDAGGSVIVLADGKFASAAYTTTASASAGTPIPFSFVWSTRKVRKIDIIWAGGYGMSGLWCGPDDTLSAPDLSGGLSIGFMTDSYGQAGPATIGSGGVYIEAALALSGGTPRAIKPYLDAVGGSGYSTNGLGTKFTSRIATFTQEAVDGGAFCGGINDGTGTLLADGTTVFSTYRAGRPNAPIFVLGAWQPSSVGGSAAAKNAILLAALQTIPGPWVFIDSVAGTWLNWRGKTGKVGAAPWFVGDGRRLDFTAALVAATSGTLDNPWAGNNGSYTMVFSDGTTKTVTLTNSQAGVSWTGAVTADAQVGVYSTLRGNTTRLISRDGIHPDTAGVDTAAQLVAGAMAAGALTA